MFFVSTAYPAFLVMSPSGGADRQFHTVFGMDPVEVDVGIGVAFCQRSIFFMDYNETCTDTLLEQPNGMIKVS